MKAVLLLTVLVIVAVFLVLSIWRELDERADRTEMNRLMRLQPNAPRKFDTAMVADLPDPARRYFEYTILPDTPLYTVADIRMTGRFSLGSKNAPNYMAMTARQVLSTPDGFVWKMSADAGLISVSGSDTSAWTRFWIAGIAPVVRAGGSQDHKRAAFGRYISEAVFWTPAALLPGPDVAWQTVSEDTAMVTFSHDGLTQDVYVTVARDGQPVEVRFSRWSDANSDKVFRLQPFGGYLSEFKEFAGFRLPTHIEAGNFFGTPEFFPFYIADVTHLRFAQLN